MEVDPPPAEPERVQTLWFEDGNLIIKARLSLFRVYRGILAAQSVVFKDMLSFPQPSESETVEGCPVVVLQDSAEDALVFFRAIFDSGFFMPHPAPTSLSTVVGVLRLSNKYEVDYLRRRALTHLSSAFPTTFADFDKENAQSWPESTGGAVTIQIAREVGALWLLPTAFYDASETIDAFTALESVDQTSFLPAFLAQRDSCVRDILRFLYEPPTIEGCTNGFQCALTRLRAFKYVRDDLGAYSGIPMGIWTEHDWGRLSDLCSTCLASLKSTHRNARRTFFDNLPQMYGLPSWAELSKIKTAALTEPVDEA